MPPAGSATARAASEDSTQGARRGVASCAPHCGDAGCPTLMPPVQPPQARDRKTRSRSRPPAGDRVLPGRASADRPGCRKVPQPLPGAGRDLFTEFDKERLPDGFNRADFSKLNTCFVCGRHRPLTIRPRTTTRGSWAPAIRHERYAHERARGAAGARAVPTTMHD